MSLTTDHFIEGSFCRITYTFGNSLVEITGIIDCANFHSELDYPPHTRFQGIIVAPDTEGLRLVQALPTQIWIPYANVVEVSYPALSATPVE